MESKDLKLIIIVGCLSVAMVLSSYIIGKSISQGLQYHGGYIRSAGDQIGGAIVQATKTTETNSDNDILDISNAAYFLKITDSELYSIMKNSKTIDGKGIPYYKIGDKVFFSKIALSKWVEKSAENCYEY